MRYSRMTISNDRIGDAGSVKGVHRMRRYTLELELGKGLQVALGTPCGKHYRPNVNAGRNLQRFH
jgi:hypothetical protein